MTAMFVLFLGWALITALGVGAVLVVVYLIRFAIAVSVLLTFLFGSPEKR